MMLPAVLDPWAGHALFEAAHLARSTPGSKVWLVSLGPKAKLQQVMMTVAQKVPFELVALDGPASGFTDSFETAAALAAAIAAIPGLDGAKLLVFGGWESASRGAGSTLQMVGERLGIAEQFQGVDQVTVGEDGSLEILERIEGGGTRFRCAPRRRRCWGWATGNLPEPRNNPQIGMANMRAIMPALQRAKATPIPNTGLSFHSVNLPKQQRETRIVKDMPAERLPAKSSPGWRRSNVETILLLAHTEPDGALAKPALECLTAALALGGSLTVGWWAPAWKPPPARSPAAAPRDSWRLRARLSRSRATQPTPPPPKRFAARPAPRSDGPFDFAMGARAPRRGISSGRPRGYPRLPAWRPRMEPRRSPLVLRQRMEAVLSRRSGPG